MVREVKATRNMLIKRRELDWVVRGIQLDPYKAASRCLAVYMLGFAPSWTASLLITKEFVAPFGVLLYRRHFCSREIFRSDNWNSTLVRITLGTNPHKNWDLCVTWKVYLIPSIWSLKTTRESQPKTLSHGSTRKGNSICSKLPRSRLIISRTMPVINVSRDRANWSLKAKWTVLTD